MICSVFLFVGFMFAADVVLVAAFMCVFSELFDFFEIFYFFMVFCVGICLWFSVTCWMYYYFLLN